MAAETSDATFKSDVLESPVPALVDFWAPWCGPCRMVAPVIDKISKLAEGKARVYKCNVDDNPMIASELGITSIPTVIVFKAGKIEKQLVGVQTEQVYKNALGV